MRQTGLPVLETVVLITAGLCAGWSSAPQAAEIRSGDKVVAIEEAPLKKGSEQLLVIPKATALTEDQQYLKTILGPDVPFYNPDPRVDSDRLLVGVYDRSGELRHLGTLMNPELKVTLAGSDEDVSLEAVREIQLSWTRETSRVDLRKQLGVDEVTGFVPGRGMVRNPIIETTTYTPSQANVQLEKSEERRTASVADVKNLTLRIATDPSDPESVREVTFEFPGGKEIDDTLARVKLFKTFRELHDLLSTGQRSDVVAKFLADSGDKRAILLLANADPTEHTRDAMRKLSGAYLGRMETLRTWWDENMAGTVAADSLAGLPFAMPWEPRDSPVEQNASGTTNEKADSAPDDLHEQPDASGLTGKSPAERLLGRWAHPALVIEFRTDTQLTATLAGQPALSGTYRIDFSKTPHRIDITFATPTGKQVKSIFEFVDKDTMRLCPFGGDYATGLDWADNEGVFCGFVNDNQRTTHPDWPPRQDRPGDVCSLRRGRTDKQRGRASLQAGRLVPNRSGSSRLLEGV